MKYAMQHNPDPLLMPPKGILLYGPPGCGKTLIAKALTNEIEANFINCDISTIKNKFVGETEKMATALFSVARKIEPCIIFIDEVDSFLS
jgi:SpoVK/Ycf46/Vps4 family AAA+-type ATPase